MLRSLNSLVGDRIIAEDGFAGEAKDFTINASVWRVAELIAKVGRWWRSMIVRIPSAVLRRPVGSSGMLPVAMTRSQTKKCLPVAGSQMKRPAPSEAASSDGPPTTSETVRWMSLCDCLTQTRDGLVGHLRDLIVEDENWHIRFLVVELGSETTRHKTLVSNDRISDIHMERSVVTLDLSATEIEESPEYDPRRPINSDFERRLHDHYGQPLKHG
jgi:hypothetical protein